MVCGFEDHCVGAVHEGGLFFGDGFGGEVFGAVRGVDVINGDAGGDAILIDLLGVVMGDAQIDDFIGRGVELRFGDLKSVGSYANGAHVYRLLRLESCADLVVKSSIFVGIGTEMGRRETTAAFSL